MNDHIVVTSINLDYLPRAVVLANSVKKHDKNVTFVIGMIETNLTLTRAMIDQLMQLPEMTNVDEIVTLESFDLGLRRSVSQLNVVEACTAVKADLMLSMLNREKIKYVTYLDPDTYCYKSIEEIRNEHQTTGPVLLTPHLIDPPIRETSVWNSEIHGSLRHGVFNLGFLSCEKSENATEVLNWWSQRLRRYCKSDYSVGIWTDQKWFDLAIVYFSGVGIVRKKSWNMAPWNIDERLLLQIHPPMLSNGETLLFFHFSKLPHTEFYESVRAQFSSKRVEELAEEYLVQLKDLDSLNPAISHLKQFRVNHQSVPKVRRRDSLINYLTHKILTNRLLRKLVFKNQVIYKIAKRVYRKIINTRNSSEMSYRIDEIGVFDELLISHWGGGGVEERISSQVASLGNSVKWGVVQPRVDGGFKLRSNILPFETTFDDDTLFVKILESSHNVQLHHVLGLEKFIPILKKCRSVEIFLHDRYFLSQFPFSDALKYLNKSPGVPGVDLPLNLNIDVELSDNELWLKNNSDLLINAKLVTAPSHYLANQYETLMLGVNVLVSPWSDDFSHRDTDKIKADEGSDAYSVTIISPTGPHKGSWIIYKVAEELNSLESNLIINIFGDLREEDLKQFSKMPNIRLMGQVPRSRIHSFLNENSTLGWIPSLTGESFSLALSDFLNSGTQVVASNLGAVAERLECESGHWLYEADSQAKVIAHDFIAISKSYRKIANNSTKLSCFRVI